MTCEKRKYPTSVAAGNAIRRMARQYGHTYKRMYWCSRCRCWHITSTEQRAKQEDA